MPPHRAPARRALRRESARDRMADGQRVRLPRHRGQLLGKRARRVRRVVRAALPVRRRPESRMGERVLVHGVRPDRPDRPAVAHRDRAESGPCPRVPPVQLRPGGAFQPGAVRRDPQALRCPDRPQLHGTDDRLRPPCARRRPGLRGLGQLPARLPAGPRGGVAGREGALSAPGASRFPGVSPRSLPDLRERTLLGHGAAAGAGQLGAVESGPDAGDAPAMGVGSLRARRGDGLLVPLAAGSLRAGADARGPAASRRPAGGRSCRGGAGRARDRASAAGRRRPVAVRARIRLSLGLGLGGAAPRRRLRLLRAVLRLLLRHAPSGTVDRHRARRRTRSRAPTRS